MLPIAKENKYFGILREIFLFHHKMYVECTQENRLDLESPNNYTEQTIIL